MVGMRGLLSGLLPVIMLCAGCGDKTTQSSQPAADLVLTNGRIYTANADQASVQAMAIEGDRIVALGSDEDVQVYVGDGTRLIDLELRRVLPGLHDTHIHPIGILEYESCNLDSRGLDLQQLSDFVADCIERFEVVEGQWLTVRQWAFSDNNRPVGNLQTLRQALDRASGKSPIILLGNDGHHNATNSLGLAQASLGDGTRPGLTARTLAEHFAEISAYVGVDANGEPDGAVNEVVPQILGAPNLLNPDPAELIPHVGQIPRRLHSLGITSMQEAAFSPGLESFYDALLAQGPLQLRIRLAQLLPPEAFMGEDGSLDMEQLLQVAGRIRDKYADTQNLDANALKYFVDGVLEGNPLANPPTLPNAAQLHPFHQPRFKIDLEAGSADLLGYIDPGQPACLELASAADTDTGAFVARHGFHPDQCQVSRGVTVASREVTLQFAREADAAGFALHFHAIGDRAVRTAVDAIEQVTPKDTELNRHSITHLQLVSDEDIKRIGKLRVPLAFSYSWAARGFEYDVMVVPFIEKLDSLQDMYAPDSYYYRHVYPANSILRAGGILAAGSDAPVDTDDPRPFFHIRTAVTRDRGEGPLNADQAITIEQAIDAYTINGARLMGQQTLTGSLEPGKKADFVILDRDIISLAKSGQADTIDEARVLQTWFDGRLVYEAENQ